ncbi:MAG: glycosyltransferase family 4 protein [Anaerolineales bacterium]
MTSIVFLLTQSLDSPSGVGRYFPLAKQLVKLNYDVKIIALHPNYAELPQKSFQSEGVSINYVAQMHVKKSDHLKSYYSAPRLVQISLSAAWQLSRAAIKNKSDIIIIGKPHPMNSIAGLIARIIHGGRLFLDCDDYESESGRFSSKWQKSIISWFEKWVPKRVNSVLTNTFFMRDKLISWGVRQEKIIYLSNGVDASRFQAPDFSEVNSLREEFCLGNKKVAGYIGSMSLPSHPVNLLLEAIAQLQDQYPEICLLMVGGGEDLPALIQQAQQLNISNSTFFVGRVPPEKISNYYALLDISIDPVYDNDAAKGRSPLKLFESWISHVPFISSDIGDRRILLGEPLAGMLANPGDPVSLADCIQKIISAPAYADELRHRGDQNVKSFTWEHLAAQFTVELQSSLKEFQHG